MKDTDLKEFSGQIIDIFEHFLSDNNVLLFNPERDEKCDEPECIDPTTIPIIFGEQYETFSADIICIIDSVNGFDEVTVQIASRRIFDAFYNLIKENVNDGMFCLSVKATADELVDKVYKEFENWKDRL